MPLDSSAFSTAADAIAEFVNNSLNGPGRDKIVAIVDSPAATSKRTQAQGVDSHFVNLFFYRMAPSGFHAAQTSNDPLFIRLSCLITPFPLKNDAAEPDPDLRILGRIVSLFHSSPILPPKAAPLPPPPAGNATRYRIQAVLLAPNMEELNHIWTTQGNELPYRLSAAYEFALVPVEPRERRGPAGKVLTATLEVDADMERRDLAPVPASPQLINIPVHDPAGGPPPVNWLPATLLVVAEGGGRTRLANSVSLPLATAQVEFAVAGLPGIKTRLAFDWRAADNGAVAGSSPVVFPIAAPTLDDAAARSKVAIARPDAARRAIVVAQPCDGAGVPIPGAPPSNRIVIDFV